MKTARIIRTNEPLFVEEVAVPRPKYDQVLVRVQSAGVRTQSGKLKAGDCELMQHISKSTLLDDSYDKITK